MKFSLLALCFLPFLVFAAEEKENNPYLDERFTVIDLYGFSHYGEFGYQLLSVRKNEVPIFQGYMERKPSLGFSGSIFLIDEKEFTLEAKLHFGSEKDPLIIHKKITKNNGRFLQIALDEGKLVIRQQAEPFLYM